MCLAKVVGIPRLAFEDTWQIQMSQLNFCNPEPKVSKEFDTKSKWHLSKINHGKPNRKYVLKPDSKF